MMNILILSPEYPPGSNWGGIATYNFNLSLLLKSLGHKVIVLCQKGEEQSFKDQKINLLYIQHITYNKFINFLYYNPISHCLRLIIKSIIPTTSAILKWNFFSYFEIRHILKKEKIDLIFTSDYYSSGLFSSFSTKGIKWIQVLHGPQILFQPYGLITIDTKLQIFLEKIDIFRNRNKRIISHSHSIIKKFKSLYQLDLVQYVPNFIFHPPSPISEVINPNNIIYFGRIENRKGVDELLKTYNKLSKKNNTIKLFLIGNFSNDFGKFKNRSIFSYLDKKNKELTKNVFIIPQINDKMALYELLKLLKGIVVLPSRYEPYGYTTIESLLLGLVVISSRNDENLIEDKYSGLYCKPKQNSIMNSILYVQDLSYQEIINLQKRGRSKALELTSPYNARKKYKELLDSL